MSCPVAVVSAMAAVVVVTGIERIDVVALCALRTEVEVWVEGFEVEDPLSVSFFALRICPIAFHTLFSTFSIP
jgi:hypothetical protein